MAEIVCNLACIVTLHVFFHLLKASEQEVRKINQFSCLEMQQQSKVVYKCQGITSFFGYKLLQYKQ